MLILCADWQFCKSLLAGDVSVAWVTYLLVVLIDPLKITFYQSRYTGNETNNVNLDCREKAVSQLPDLAQIILESSGQEGSSKELVYGEQLLRVNTKGSDNGAYRCIEKMILDNKIL